MQREDTSHDMKYMQWILNQKKPLKAMKKGKGKGQSTTLSKHIATNSDEILNREQAISMDTFFFIHRSETNIIC